MNCDQNKQGDGKKTTAAPSAKWSGLACGCGPRPARGAVEGEESVGACPAAVGRWITVDGVDELIAEGGRFRDGEASSSSLSLRAIPRVIGLDLTAGHGCDTGRPLPCSTSPSGRLLHLLPAPRPAPAARLPVPPPPRLPLHLRDSAASGRPLVPCPLALTRWGAKDIGNEGGEVLTSH
ncbi:LOW QUALITY PROTEIN: hypothetical protein U9M48_017067 [Paspalum notatum var. saurae]|uniref:Uncharacterized protein n=1 Tax=Paspalum notatum var. saurae TaxID=547442 RepID=A0AAQ3T8Y7_PASNO